MSIAVENFDTLRCANRLKASGVASMTAEVLADELNIVLLRQADVHKKESATKQDLQLIEASIRKDLDRVELTLSKDISDVRSELRQEMHGMETRLISSMGKIVFGGFSIFSLVVAGFHYFKILV